VIYCTYCKTPTHADTSCPYQLKENNELSIDTIAQGHFLALIKVLLNHNAAVIQAASEVIAAGPVYKQSQLKRIRNFFNDIHDRSEEEYNQAIKALTAEITKEKL